MTKEKAITYLEKNPIYVHDFSLIEDAESLAAYREEMADEGISQKTFDAVQALHGDISYIGDEGEIPSGMKYFKTGTIDGYPFVVVSKIKGFEKLLDWRE